MEKANRWRRVGLSLAVAAALAGALIGIHAALPKDGELRAALVAQLGTWTGGHVTIAGPTRVSLFPRARIEVDRLHIRGMEPGSRLELVDVKTLGAEFGVWSLLQGEPRIGRLTLREPQIRLRSDAAADPEASGAPPPRLIMALREAPFTQIDIERGLLVIGGAVGAESFREISANLSVSQGGAVSTTGVLTWRGRPVDFSLQTGTPNFETKGPSAPIQIALDGKLITANVDGLVAFKDKIRLSGTLNLEVPNTRGLARWMGVVLPPGSGLGAFVVSGDFNWTDMNIGFDNGTFTLDGNRAIGALAVRYDRARPQIEGTLALQLLSLTQYLAEEKPPAESAEGSPESSQAKQAAGSDSTSPTPAGLDLSFPLLQRFDLDLRVSATQFEANAIQAGQTALTLTLESGELAAAYSILDLFDGRSSGQLEIDTNHDEPHLHLTATMTEIAAQRFIEAFKLESPLRGGMNVSLAVSGNGRKFQQLLQDLSGTIDIAMPAGEVNIDLAKLVAGAARGELKGWNAARGQTTGFSDFSAHFDLEEGIARSSDFKMQTGPLKITGDGTIDIAERNLNWRLDIPNPVAARLPRIGALVSDLHHSLLIRGPWSDPTFHLERKQANQQSGPAQPVSAQSGSAR